MAIEGGGGIPQFSEYWNAMHCDAFDYYQIAAGKVAQVLLITLQFADIIQETMLRIV